MAQTAYKPTILNSTTRNDITDGGRLERAISTSSWVENLIGANKKSDRVSFHPLHSTVTHDAEKITPEESIVYIKRRSNTPSLTPEQFIETDAFESCSNADTLAVTSIRSASEIINSIASTSLLQFAMYGTRKLTPIYLSPSNSKEYGGKFMRRTILKKCFSKKDQVDSLIEELNKRKINAAKAFVTAVMEKSVVNAALAAWSAGNAANLQHLVQYSMIKYGPGKTYETAGIYRTTSSNNKKTFTSAEYVAEIKKRHKGSLNFDSAEKIFTTALGRIFSEFETSVADNKGMILRQNRRRGLSDGLYGMLAPRDKYTVADYMEAEKSTSEDQIFSKTATDFEILRGGSKRKADTETDDLRDTLAKSIADTSIDSATVSTSADAAGADFEWSMHITQLFSQAFLETMSSLLSCSFGVQNPFTDQGFDDIANIIRKSKDNRYVDMNPSVLADEYLTLAGNFQIAPFHSSDPYDIVEGRQVCPNTPLLSIITRYKIGNNNDDIGTDVEFRDRLLVKDDILKQAIANTNTTPVANRKKPTEVGAAKLPMLAGCVPIIRGHKRDPNKDDIVNNLANEWYISTGIYHGIGKTSAAIWAGYQRAIASSTNNNKALNFQKEDQKMKKSMRRNADRTARLSALLGQTISEWSHQEHNSTLDSFWSSFAATRTKTSQDALSRSQIIDVRKQIDGKGSDQFLTAEKQLRNSFYNSITASYDFDSINECFKNDTSGVAKQSWENYLKAVSKLADYERGAFNIYGLLSAIKSFKFPLVVQGIKRRHRLNNVKAASRVINGLTEMIIQSAFNGTSAKEIGVGIGSAADGWGTSNNQLEPTRMKALKMMAKFGKHRRDVISIPVSRSRGSISGVECGVTSVNVPAIILSHLISDKKILDDLCGGGINLGHEITKFIQTISSYSFEDKTRKNTKPSVFATDKHSIIFLRYIWFNTAIISLTDSNIKIPLNVSCKGLGDSLYNDYLAIRSLLTNYNNRLSAYSVKAISDHYTREENKKTTNITIKTDQELLDVLQQTTDVLTAFTDKKDGISPKAENMKQVIIPIKTIDTIKEEKVILSNVSLYKFTDLITFLHDIGKMNLNLQKPLKHFAMGESLTKEDMDNYKQPDLAKIFGNKLQSYDYNTPIGEEGLVIIINLNDTEPLLKKSSLGYAAKRINILNSKERTEDEETEYDALTEDVNSDSVKSLINEIGVPSFFTPAEAINVMAAFTADGRFSNENTHMNILLPAIESLATLIVKYFKNDTLTINLNKIREFVQFGLIVCLICIHSQAGRYIINPAIKDFSKLLLDVAAESSLVVSRLQSSFYPIPPAIFSLTDMFKPDRNLFNEMSEDYISEIVDQLTNVKSKSLSERCNDTLSATKMFKAGENFNADETPPNDNTAPDIISRLKINLKNPAVVWSSYALPHFDVAVESKLQPSVTLDQKFKLSTYYHGMHKLSLNSDCKPQNWDSTLAGNLARKFYGLNDISDNNRSFNLALDTLLATPAEICDLVSRETVRTSNDVIHNIGSPTNMDKLQKILQLGTSVVKALPNSSKTFSPTELSIKDTVAALSKTVSTSEGYSVAKEIVRTWNTLSLANISRETTNSFCKKSDVLRATLETVPSFRQQVVQATRSVYELAAVCSVLSKDEAAKSASRQVMATIEETSPVIHDIGIGRVAGLVSTVASPRQYKKFLHTVADYRNSLVRLVNVNNPLSNNNGMKAVYDGLLSKTPGMATNTISLLDKFWMGVFNESLETKNLFADKMTPVPMMSIYGSRLNTYAAMSTNVDRLKDSMTMANKDRRDKIKKSMTDIENYIISLSKDTNGPLSDLIDAQNLYNKLSDITASSTYSDFCKKKNKTARQQSDSILRSLLHKLASSMSNAGKVDVAHQLALASHIIMAKGVANLGSVHKETFDNLLSVAGVSGYAYISANALCQRLKRKDIQMFLGGTMLQQGLFITFLLNNVIFAQLSDTIKMDDLTAETKSTLLKLIGFCETLARALSARHARRKITPGGEEAKADISFVSALYSAYNKLMRKTDGDTVAKIFGDMMLSGPNDYNQEKSIRAPRLKRKSTLIDVLDAPSVIQKTFMTSYPEKAAASSQVRRAGGSLLLSNKMEKIYGTDVLKDMRASHNYLMDDVECLSDYDEELSEDDKMSISSSSSSSMSDSSSDEESSDGGYSYDALESLNAAAAPLSSVYGDDDDYDYEDDKRRNTVMDDILREVRDSDEDYYSDDSDDSSEESAARRRSERIQYGPGFISSSYVLYNPQKSRDFLTRGKKFRHGESSWMYFNEDDTAIFSDEYSSHSSDSEIEELINGGRRRRFFKHRAAEDQCAFIKRVTRAFVPSKISLVNGRVSLITPVGTDTAAGFIEMYQKSNKKERENLRKQFEITATDSKALPDEYFDGSSSKTLTQREFRRSIIKASAFVMRTQANNAEKFYDVFTSQKNDDPSEMLSNNILYSKQLKAIIEKRNHLLKNLTDISSCLFTSSTTQGPGDNTQVALENARNLLVNKDCQSGYLGIPLCNLSKCLRKKAVNPSDTDNTVGIGVDDLLSITDRNHLDWLTTSAIAFARFFNVTTFHALESTLKTFGALNDMYNAFTKLICSQNKQKISVKSNLLDMIFSTRMAHLEAVMGLVCPTAFINHEMPSDIKQRENIQSLALNILRGVNCNQLPRGDIGDTLGLLTFLTCPKFAGRKGERGGLSLYRMSITDALCCQPPDYRLKGAVSLEVGKWKMCDNSVFSKRSKLLADFCSKRYLSLENAVGPIARFIPNGSPLNKVGLSKQPTTYVRNDPAALRLQAAEYECGAAGRFITASAMGNLYGQIDHVLNLAKKFTTKHLMLDVVNDTDSSITIKDVAKKIITKMKARRNKSLKTPFGNAVISQATNLPAVSDAIVLRAREMKNSITTIVEDLSKSHGIARPTKVSVKKFDRILETSAVLANTKMTLRGIENRLAAASTQLEQFKRIKDDGLSESRAIIAALAETLNTLNSGDDEERFKVTDFLKEDCLFEFIVNNELKNIRDAKRHITAAIEGACQLHAQMLSMLAASADCEERFDQKMSDNPMPFSNSNCGTIIKHPGTGLWLKTDEDCNTSTDNDNDHKRVARSILSIIRSNQNKIIRSELHSMYFGKYAVSDIFALDDSDVKNVDKLVEKLGAALAAKTAPVSAVTNTTSSESEYHPSSSLVGSSLSKKIPYIPIIFENKHTEEKPQNANSKKEEEEQKAALRYMEIHEAHELSNILSVATNHKFVTHNQAATVALFNVNKNDKSSTSSSILTKLPASTQQQLSSSSSSTSVSRDEPPVLVNKLRDYAIKVASDLVSSSEYNDLTESQRKINSALTHLDTVENSTFFNLGVRPEIKQSTMSTLSQSQSAKDSALELFEKTLKQLQAHAPDSSMSTVSLPINSNASPMETTTTTDFFQYAYQKLNSNENQTGETLEKDTITKKMIDQDSSIRVPLLLSFPQFASVLREVVNSLGEYYQRIDKIKQKISTDSKEALSSSFEETRNEIETDKNTLNSVINDLSEMYSNEADAIKTAIKVLENKKSELEMHNNHTMTVIESITGRIEAGENNVNVNDMLNFGIKADTDQQFLQNLKQFALENSGVTYTPVSSESHHQLLRDGVDMIKKGQEGITTDYETALSKFPSPATSYDNLTMQTAEKQQRDRLASVQSFIALLTNRLSKLKTRLDDSLLEATNVETKKREISSMFTQQIDDRIFETKKNVSIAEAAAQSALVKDTSQSAFMMSLSGRVDKLLQRIEQTPTPKESTPPSPPTAAVEEDPIFSSCFMSPFHETIKRLTALYNRDGKGPLSNNASLPTSDADLQLVTIVDLSTAVLNSTTTTTTAARPPPPDTVPSSIVPGLCQLCAMVVTNLHEATHESSHSFNFEGKRSRKKLFEMLNAVISGSENPRIRHDVLAMLEANNGHIKEFSFTKKQKVACITPVNTLLSGTFNGDITPNTVLLPTSELIHCPGVDNDKFRSMIHRSSDRTIADAPKTAASIVETLARTAPNAENLFFPFKDQRRHFNSITDAIISNMSSEASSQLNTTCDQNLVKIDQNTGFPVFIGRRPGKSRVLETEASNPVARGGIPGCTKDRQKYVDMGVKFMVAPGSLLNANKEETLRLNRLADINNVRHYGTDIHVTGANAAWRINEVVNSASAYIQNESAARKLILLGAVSAVSAQKSTQYNNDPTAMVNSTLAVQNLVNEAFPTPASMATYAGVAESAFATQLAYKQRLFSSSQDACAMDILGMIRRYNECYDKLYPIEKCDPLLKRSMSNTHLVSTPVGAFEEASSAFKNKISFNPDSFSINKFSVDAMTDTIVDTLSAVSTLQNRNHKLLPPSILSLAVSGKPTPKNHLLQTISKITRDASFIAQMNGISPSSVSAFLRASVSSQSGDDKPQATAAQLVLEAILNGARESNARLERLGIGPVGAGRSKVNALYRNGMASILQLNEDEITRDLNEVESKLETRQLREAFNELKKSMLVSSSGNSLNNTPLSVLLSRDDAASGRLALSNNTNVTNAIDEFNTTPLLVRHLMLDSGKSPIPISREVKGILTQPKAITARALLSEASPLLTELCLFNTRDTPPERAIDRLVTSAYLVKQAKRFDGVDPLFPAAITGAAHLMLSSIDSNSNNPSSFLNNIKLHMNDTTCYLKNIERYERFLGKYGDSYAMTHKQNCNCPFALHHDFRPSADEALVPSFAFARPEVTVEEIRATPYQTNKLLNDKHYVMSISKIDTRITGSAVLKKVSEWTDMRTTVNFNGAFEPSRLALSNSGMTTAGVNLDVIVRPNNAKNVMGILECHRKHICHVDAKSTISAAMPALFQSTSNEFTSELIQNALPHNRYVQKSTMNAVTVIFANILEQLICDLGKVIVNELARVLMTSVSETVYEDTKSMIDMLGSEALFQKQTVNQEDNTNDTHSLAPGLVSESVKNAIYQTLISNKASKPENVPFASSANGLLAYDFLLSKDNTFQENNAEMGAAEAMANMPESSMLRKHLAKVFEAISKQVSDAEFGNILDEIEAKIIDGTTSSPHALSRAIRQEFNKVLSFLKILRRNITPSLLDPNGILAEKVAIYLSLLSTKSKLENLLHYGLSNSSSIDLSHLKPINGSNNIKNIEDTFMYRNVHPVLIMALPENFTALLQQEQYDVELAIENRRSLTTFLNHPNTTSMSTAARASIGAGGGNPLGLYISSQVLHESTVTTCDPVVDTDSNLSFHSSITQDPIMVVNPFKDSAQLRLSDKNAILDDKCSYLQVSMPTEFSGLVTNTGIRSFTDTGDTFQFIRRDTSPIYLPKITPSVLCSDASTNLLDNFSRADVVLHDISVRFGYMPEIIAALASVKGTSSAEIIKEMSARAGHHYESEFVDAKSGDVIVKNGTFPDVKSLQTNVSWGEENKQKLHAKVIPTFMISNPLASASVNGFPITSKGYLLAEEKRKKAAGITSSKTNAFGSGCIGLGALRAAANSRLTSDLEPLKKGWQNLIQLQDTFSKAAVHLRNVVNDSGENITPETSDMAHKLHESYKKLNECKEILQNQTSILVATSDLVTGGYAGDPAMAMVSPVRPEMTGIIGAISAPIRGLGHLLKRDGVTNIQNVLVEKLNISSSNGRIIPEHGVVHKSSSDLLTDADSIYNLYSIEKNDKKLDESGKLYNVMAALGLKKDGRNIVSTAKYISNLLAAPEYGNRRDLTKRQAIVHLLVSNPDLLNNVANSLFLTIGQNSISPLTTNDVSCATIGGALEKNNATSNSLESLNRLFTSRLYTLYA